MSFHTETLTTFIVSLGQDAHRTAEQFCQSHTDWQKAERVYLNSLSVYAVNYYLTAIGYITNWPDSDSYNAVAQTLLDVADLIVQDCGKIECRRVLSGAEAVYIPEEVWDERIGYVAVALNDALDTAEVLGFYQQADNIEVPLSQLKPLQDLSSYLNSYRQAKVSAQIERVNLGQWFQDVFTAGWHSVEELIAAGHSELAWQFRGSRGNLALPSASPSVLTVTRTKVMRFSSLGTTVLVLVTLEAEDPDAAIHIQIELVPVGEQSFLPVGLQMSVLNQQGEPIMNTQIQETQDGVRLKFSADPDEQFSIKILLSDVAIVEEFLV